MNNFISFISKHWVSTAIISLIAVLISIQKYYSPNIELGITGYNNYIIFETSFDHLMNHQNIYDKFPEHFDFFKYSPTFALLMGVFAYLPHLLGLIGWNLLNVLVLFFGIKKLPLSNKKHFLLFVGFILIELITSTQNSQCNALIAGLFLYAYHYLKKGNMLLATLMIVLSIYIKLFGVVGFALFLFYPNKIKAAIYSAGWFILLGALPLLVISFEELKQLYIGWMDLLSRDHNELIKFSVMGILHTWCGVALTYKKAVLIAGMIIFCIPLLRIKLYNSERFKLLYLSSILLWVIIFNHMAESATFVIAVVGIGVWFFTKDRKSKVDYFLVFLTILLTILSPTDIFPKSFRTEVLVPYMVKVFPCILVWLKITWELLTIRPKLEIANLN